MARDTWFETVGIRAAEREEAAARSRCTAALLAASEKGVTVADNVDAFAELGFAPARHRRDRKA